MAKRISLLPSQSLKSTFRKVTNCKWNLQTVNKYVSLTTGSSWEALLWIVVVFVGAALTIWMCIRLIVEFGEAPTSTSLLVNTDNPYPYNISPVFCVSVARLYASKLWYMQLYDEKEAGFDSVTEDPLNTSGTEPWPKGFIKWLDIIFKSNGSGIEPPLPDKVFPRAQLLRARYDKQIAMLAEAGAVNYRRQHQNAVKAFFDATNLTKERVVDFTNGSLGWSPSWMFISLLCLNMATRLEFGPQGLTDLMIPLAASRRIFGFTLISSDDRLEACILLEKCLKKLNISTDDYRQRFGFEVARLVDVQVDEGKGVIAMMMASNSVRFPDHFLRTSVVNSLEVCYLMNPKTMKTMKNPNLV